jgi:DNA-binding transcriptional MerR regulator/methylmalonyl-CoA mutase cobalamin-binding subunit
VAGKYTVNEVEERTHVPATTLRQWERRYRFPCPERSEAGYRLYSDDDLRDILAMKRYIAEGVPASQAAKLVREHEAPKLAARPLDSLRRELVARLVQVDEAGAERLLSEAYALHSVEDVVAKVIMPALVAVGDKWHRGEIDVAGEHFASAYVVGRLRQLLHLQGVNHRAPRVVVACAPENQHELAALALAALLRRRGYRVYYLGANTPVRDLAQLAARVDALAVMLSATTASSVAALEAQREALSRLAPLVVYGGAAFDERPEAAARLNGHYLGKDLIQALEQFDRLVQREERGP